MPETIPVEIPFVNLNDETVKLSAWLVADGEEVREGQNIAEVETSKALVELGAPASGRIFLKCPAGRDLPVGSIIAYIGDADHDGEAVAQFAAVVGGSVHESAVTPALSGTRFSKKALELLQSRRIPLDAFAGASMVREQDVRDYAESALVKTPTRHGLHFALQGISVSGVTFPAILSRTDSGRMDPRFLDELQTDSGSVSNLPSAEKCALYREHGAEIGEGVSIGRGTTIIAPQIQLGDRVRFGENSSIILRERFAAATLSSFREGLVVRGGTVVFGENTFAGSRIQIGGGGNADPWALFVAGDNVYLGDDLFINICRPVLVGKEAFLTQRAILVTHNIGHSILEGNENAFDPIVLEDFSQVGMNSTIYAGARVGQGAILGSNSYLISVIPKGKLAMGVPARVVRDAARPVDRKKQLEIVDTMVRQFHELLRLKGVHVSSIHSVPFLNFKASHGGKTYQMGFAEFLSAADHSIWTSNENVLWTFDSKDSTSRSDMTHMDLLAKTLHGASGLFVDSAREFLRKRGIRLEPGPWRYQKGLI